MFRRRSGIAVAILISFVVTSLYSQTSTVNSSDTVIQSKVKVVLVDVVVTDRNDQAVQGLPKEDFQIFEAGKPQTIASFEEHKGAPPNSAKMPALPPHFYSNYPLNQNVDSVNVLVLDALNTPLDDQANVRLQMVDYLKKIQPGPRLAIFTLRSYMRMVEGFTADPSALLAALNHKNWGGGPQSSQLLRTYEEDLADKQLVNDIKGVDASAAAAMADFLQERKSFQTYSRVQVTLEALQQLARYLGGFPGRKNVIWFSGSFPVGILPGKGQEYDFSFSEKLKADLRKTTNMLAASQVAIYPIGAKGVASPDALNATSIRLPDPNTPPGQNESVSGSNMAVGAVQIAGSTLSDSGCVNDNNPSCDAKQQLRETYVDQASMDEIAKDTGGKAFYNTNGLKEAMDDAIKNGEHYYSISYSPTNKELDGSYRPISVKLAKGHYKLSFRRGYFAEDAKPKKDQPPTRGGPLQPLMARGMPDSSQILYEIRVLPAEHQPDAQTPVAGDNAKVKAPVTRYAVDFAVSTKDVSLQVTPDGVRHGNLEVTLVAYDHDGNTLNWLVRNTSMSLKPELYAAFQQGGVQLHEEIDVPAGDIFLRTGIYDPATQKAGTLEIPLQGAVPAVTASK